MTESIMVILTALVLLGLLIRWFVLMLIDARRKVIDWFAPKGVTFGIRDVPLSKSEWERFAALAVARGIAQKTLLADCVKFYLQEKMK